MQINKKLLIGIVIILIIILVLFGTLIFTKKKANNDEETYYYRFIYDDNLVSQSVWVYNSKDEVQSNYNLYYDNKLITLTKADKAVLTMVKADLKEHQTLEMAFRDKLDKKYKVEYRE